MSRMLDQAEWQDWICDDLNSVLALLRERYGSQVSGVHVDMKSAIAEVYLVGYIPAEAVKSLGAEFSPNTNLRFVSGSAVCLAHYSSIKLSAPVEGRGEGGGRGRAWGSARRLIAKVLRRG
jgi:hypothetical protein